MRKQQQYTGGGPVLWFSSILKSDIGDKFLFHGKLLPLLYVSVAPLYKKYIGSWKRYVTVPDGPGLGIEFREEPFKNGDAIVETIAEM